MAHYHFIGIGGIGMSGLARLLLEQNHAVSGSDIAFNGIIEELFQKGAVIFKGHDEKNVPLHAKIVYTSEIQSDNPEYQLAKEKQLPLLHRSDLLAELIQGKESLAIAGTHGKTTTSSLLASTLLGAGLDASYAIGGVLKEFDCNARAGKGRPFVLEADESDRSFLKYHPFGAIVTNIDHDHLTNYEGSFELLKESFMRFILQVENPCLLFLCKDDPVLSSLNCRGQTYGFDSTSDWHIQSMRQEGFTLFFDLAHRGLSFDEIALSLAGKHNVLNAAAVFGLCLTLGISEEEIRKAFRQFKGVQRRCDIKGSFSEVLFIDDYAHHPAEILTTLRGIKHAVGSRRVIAVYQPHRYTRTQECLGSFGQLFDEIDELILTDIYGAGEAPIKNLSADNILQELAMQSSTPSRYIPRTALSHFLSRFVRPGDVVVSLGAGDITKLWNETILMLEKQPETTMMIG